MWPTACARLAAELLVVVGSCTHFGCSPVTISADSANPTVPAGWRSGFPRPCHGSIPDFAGRVFQNTLARYHATPTLAGPFNSRMKGHAA